MDRREINEEFNPDPQQRRGQRERTPNGIPPVLEHLSVFRVLGALYVLILLWSPWYVVDNSYNAAVQRLGAYVRTEEAGLHFKLPWPFETTQHVDVQKVNRIEIGFRTVEDSDPVKYEDVPEEQETLTSDMNIVDLDFVLQYRRTDAYNWLFSVEDPEAALRLIAQSSMRMVNAGTPFDEIVTGGRGLIQEQTEQAVAQLVSELNLGAGAFQVQLQDVHPPQQVIRAFQDVNSAKEDRQKSINDAEGFRNERIPQARGHASKIVEESVGYREDRIRNARGDASRFLQVLERYRQAPQITAERMRLETLERVLSGKGQVIDLSDGGSILKHLAIGKDKQ